MANVHGIQHGGGEKKNPYARPPQAAGVVEPALDHQNVRQVSSEKALAEALKTATNRLVVLHFYCPWYPPSHKMAASVARLSAKYPNVMFLRLDAEALPQIASSEKYRVTSIPYFIFFKKQSIEDRKDTDSEEWLEQAIMRLSGGRAIVSGAGNRLGTASEAAATSGAAGNDNSVNPAIDALLQMGFSENSAKRGLAATGNSVEAAAAYLLDHPELEQNDSGASGSAGASGDAEGGEGEHLHSALCNRCKRQIRGIRYKCESCPDFDLCGGCYPMRVMWHDEEHVFAQHAQELTVQEGGQEKKTKLLTDEEKEAEVKRLRELMEAKRVMREEDEKRKEREMELRRRVEARSTVEQKRKWEEEKVRIEAEKIRLAKEKDEKHKQAVLEKIRREKGEKSGKIVEAKAEVKAEVISAKAEVLECVVQVRGAGGVIATFRGPPQSTLSDVAASLPGQLSREKISFSSAHPRVVYSGPALAATTLAQAGLVPRGILILEK